MVKILDEKPQFLNLNTAQETVLNTYREVPTSTPVVTVSGSNKAIVMEVLKIFYNHSTPEIINVLRTSIAMTVATRSFSTLQQISSPGVLARIDSEIEVFDSAATDATVVVQYYKGSAEHVVDLTDGAGNGILVASKNLYLGVKGNQRTVLAQALGKILYRLVEVSAAELVGIIAE